MFGGDQTPKSTFGGGAAASPFGSTTSQSSQASSLFGNNAEKPKTGLFGSSNNEAKPSPGLFGSATTNASSGSMFGEKKEEPKPTGLFGGSGGGFGGLGKEFDIQFLNLKLFFEFLSRGQARPRKGENKSVWR